MPPQNSKAYHQRGKFLASTYAEAEFWGRPLDDPQKVKVARPLIGDEATIERALFGRLISDQDISLKKRWALDAKMKRVATAKGYDSIVLMASVPFKRYIATGKLPRSIELNILNAK